MNADELRTRLRALEDPQAAAFAARFFKTGPGQYGEGDIFLGIRVPVLRALVREYRSLPIDEAGLLLQSEIHEERLLALLFLAARFPATDAVSQKRIYEFYLANTRWINNWNLVDSSAAAIVGGYLAGRSRRPLDRLARSRLLWERRIGIVATHHFILRNDFADTLRITERLLGDQEDLIHKAAGWMLREVGKKNVATLDAFLRTHCRTMPRTMLRYAIERFPEDRRQAFLKGAV